MSFVGEQIKKYRNIKGMTQQDIEYSAPVEHPGRLRLNTLVAIG